MNGASPELNRYLFKVIYQIKHYIVILLWCVQWKFQLLAGDMLVL
jgi:hypothetical protein